MKIKSQKQFKVIISFCLALIIYLNPVLLQNNSYISSAIMQDQTETYKNSKYLKEYFDISLSESFKGEDFVKAAKKISGDVELESYKNFNSKEAVIISIKAAGLDELANTYTDEKTNLRLKTYQILPEGDNLNYIAAALDTKLISKDIANKAVKEDKISSEDAKTLLMNIAEITGKGRNYLGNASDKDIYSKINNAWNEFYIFDDEVLNELGKKSVENQITTGYGIKSSDYDARFLEDLTLQYGHSDIKHCTQLIGLLNSENIDAKVQLEPKISIYQYLLEWGDIPESTPTYEVRKFSDNLYLVYAVEYDLKLEFENKSDMLKFDKVVKNYAKKNKDDSSMDGLLYESWWQPLYSTKMDKMPQEDYHLIYDMVVENGKYSIHPFTTPDKKDEVEKSIESLYEGIDVKPVARYANTAFYNYLTGEDYQ